MDSIWSPRQLCTCPIDAAGSQDDTLALLARISESIGYAPGDGATFSADRIENGRFWARVPFKLPTLQLVLGSEADWQAYLPIAAAERGVEPLTPEEITLLHAAIRIGDAAQEVPDGDEEFPDAP